MQLASNVCQIVEVAAQKADRILGLEGNSASFIMLPEWRNGDIYLAELQQVGVAQYNNSERILHSLLRRSELNHFFCEMAAAKKQYPKLRRTSDYAAFPSHV